MRNIKCVKTFEDVIIGDDTVKCESFVCEQGAIKLSRLFFSGSYYCAPYNFLEKVKESKYPMIMTQYPDGSVFIEAQTLSLISYYGCAFSSDVFEYQMDMFLNYVESLFPELKENLSSSSWHIGSDSKRYDYLLPDEFKNIVDGATPSLCCDCQYCGDKYSFPMPNNLKDTFYSNSKLKHYYCCNGDCEHYMKDITGKNMTTCEYFEEL